ncbi:MAG: gamma-glutamyltransferase [Acetobacteraceae bacterium]
MRRIGFLLLTLGLPLPAPAWTAPARAEDAPRTMVVTPHRLATEAGEQILQAGGSAVDAAIAVQMVLAVVAPQVSGIGGGGVLLHYDGATHAVTGWDGRETAAAATPDSRPDPEGALPATGGRAVGVPGALQMLQAAYYVHGRLPWADLVAPAIHLATQGVPVSPALARTIRAHAPQLRQQPATRALFFQPDGTPLAAGDRLANPALAQALQAIAASGANGLLRGPIAAEIATTVRGDANPGLVTTDDLAAYTARRRPPLCAPYRERTVCSLGAPFSGGPALLQALAMLRNLDLAALDPADAGTTRLLVAAERMAQAEAARAATETGAAPPPDDLLARALPIGPRPGDRVAAPVPYAEPGVSIVAIVDAQGDAVAVGSSLGAPFGSGLMVQGVLLNAAMADFPIRKAAEPGKRPATPMAPGLVLDHDGQLLAVLGSSVPAALLRSVVGVVDWRLAPAQILAQPAGARPAAPEATALIVLTPDGPAGGVSGD